MMDPRVVSKPEAALTISSCASTSPDTPFTTDESDDADCARTALTTLPFRFDEDLYPGARRYVVAALW